DGRLGSFGLGWESINRGVLLKATFESLLHAKPASKNKFRSENSMPDGITANFSGPVKGNRNSKLNTAIRVPIRLLKLKLPVLLRNDELSYPRIKCGYPKNNGYSAFSWRPARI